MASRFGSMLAVLALFGVCCGGGAVAEEEVDLSKATGIATFGAGCFWGVEHNFRQVEGVADAAVGYAGGDVDNPGYRQVCSGTTGHTEVVQLRYDPDKVGYEKLLEVFWSTHDPTTPNRQGPDVGWQYRSVVFYHDEEQKAAAEKMKQELDESGRFKNPIVTAIEPAPTFWRAEEYHQRYYEKNGIKGCRVK